jgi:hypothetical protein
MVCNELSHVLRRRHVQGSLGEQGSTGITGERRQARRDGPTWPTSLAGWQRERTTASATVAHELDEAKESTLTRRIAIEQIVAQGRMQGGHADEAVYDVERVHLPLGKGWAEGASFSTGRCGCQVNRSVSVRRSLVGEEDGRDLG